MYSDRGQDRQAIGIICVTETSAFFTLDDCVIFPPFTMGGVRVLLLKVAVVKTLCRSNDKMFCLRNIRDHASIIDLITNFTSVTATTMFGYGPG